MNQEPYPGEEHIYSHLFNEKLKVKQRPFWRRHLLKIYAVATTALVLVLGYSAITLAMAQGPSSGKPNPTPKMPWEQPPSAGVTPTPLVTTPSAPQTIPSGTVLCHADWSQGMNGWSGTPDWKYVSQMLANDGTSYDSTILAPCSLTTGNYAVEAEIQYVRTENYSGSFGILARGAGGGSTGYIGLIRTGDYSGAAIMRGDKSLAFANEYKVDIAKHTYRLEVKDEKLLFFVDSQKIVETTDTTYLSAGRAGLVVQGHTQVYVKSFQVTAL